MRFHVVLSTAATLALTVALGACGGQAAPTGISEEVKGKLGFDPSTVEQEHKGEIGVPGLPEGFTYEELVPRKAVEEPDVIALDPSEKYLYFVTHLAHPDGSVYRVDLATKDLMRLTTRLHRPGGISYYAPGDFLIVAEEGTGVGPQERELGFHRIVMKDQPDQPPPPPVRAMGQFRGEGILPVGDGSVIYLMEDLPQGGHLYKYEVAASPDLTKGTLYTFKQDQGWIKTAYLEAPDTGKEGTAYFAGEDIHMGKDGKLYAVLSAEAETRVVTIDLNTAKLSNFVTAGKTKGFERPDQMAFAPNGTLFVTGSGDIWAALPDGPDEDTLSDGVYRFLTGLGTVQGIQFTGDGSTLYVAARGEGDVVIAVKGFQWK
ncbi:MAG: hypothetical protein HY681_06815 [Chloroflexi bacterium]|nr:hypothetical protein [Chloroflexota bacterium]